MHLICKSSMVLECIEAFLSFSQSQIVTKKITVSIVAEKCHALSTFIA